MKAATMTNTRRDIFKFAGGAVAGAFFTPAPWRLITDTALWSENWPGIPRPIRGEVTTRFTNCALCPAGCAVRARCIGPNPVSLAGVHGGLCPFGITAHHLPYHPARLKQGDPGTVAAELQARGHEGMAILDLNPGRTASWTHRRAMAALKGTYIAAVDPLAYDLSGVKTVLTIGTPLLDGWGTPAKVFAARTQFRHIHAEAMESRTAIMADEWVALAPGTERVYARQVLSALRGEGASTAARELLANGPSLAIGDMPEIAEINRLLGAWGRSVVARAEAPVPEAWKKQAAAITALQSVPDTSIHTLLIDESAATSFIPWSRIVPKLAPGALTVTFAATRGGYARHTQHVLPIAVFPEVLEDVGPAADSVRPAWRLSTPLASPPTGVVSPAEFTGALAGVSASNTLRERAGAIHQHALGTVINYASGEEKSLKSLSADDFWKIISEGGAWQQPDAAIAPPPLPSSADATATDSTTGMPLIAIAEAAAPAMLSPVMTKLYQESNLRLAPNRVALHPEEARAAKLRDGMRAMLETRAGRCAVQVTIDTAVPPGAVCIGSSQGIQDICAPSMRARVVPA